jgi:RNA polymerase sigma-70 factor (ECF subfamily)
VDAVGGRGRGAPAALSTAWLIGVARHKLCDHWRRQAREERTLRAVAAGPGADAGDPWDGTLDAVAARAVLGRLAPQHRAALTLRYVDDLPVPDVAAILGRSLHATEALLVRARSAFRAAYAPGGGKDGDG